MPLPPSSPVLEAFSIPASSDPSPLPGGQGTSFLIASTVLKRLDSAEAAEEAEWTSQTLSSLPHSPHFVLPAPILASNGRYVYEGWTAMMFCEGTELPVGYWRELFTAAGAFHKTLEGVPEPVFLRKRKHPWARADRVAWGEEEVTIVSALIPLYERLLALRKDVATAPAQLVHGDLSGNVLFGSEGEKPVIIDFSPFWRCVHYSVAIAVVDGIADFGEEGEGILVAAGFVEGDGNGKWERDKNMGMGWVQMLIKALIFRVVARSELVGAMGELGGREVEGFERVMRIIEKYI